MAVASVNQYRVLPGQREAFIGAARETFALAQSLGASAALRNALVGGAVSGVQSAIFLFANPAARGEYLDNVTKPEHVARHALTQLARSGGVTLLGRAFLDELPAGTDLPAQPQVLSSIRFRVAPGRESEADQALLQGIELRRTLGIEAHLHVAQYAGASTGLRFLAIHASSHKALAEDAAAVVANRQRLGGLGPIPLAIAAGAMTMTGSTISTLVAL